MKWAAQKKLRIQHNKISIHIFSTTNKNDSLGQMATLIQWRASAFLGSAKSSMFKHRESSEKALCGSMFINMSITMNY